MRVIRLFCADLMYLRHIIKNQFEVADNGKRFKLSVAATIKNATVAAFTQKIGWIYV
jgi:hypothetical protein